jgi:hypothetical protein
MPRSVVMGEIPAEYGKAYNLGYRHPRKHQPKAKAATEVSRRATGLLSA